MTAQTLVRPSGHGSSRRLADEVTMPPNRRESSPEQLALAREQVSDWIGRFNRMVETRRFEEAGDLFLADGEWRDLVAVTVNVGHVTGPEAIAARLGTDAVARELSPLAIDETFTPAPAYRSGEDVVEAMVVFRTSLGPGRGVLRLMRQDEPSGARARTLLTTLDELDGFEERVGDRRPSGKYYSRTFAGPNWRDLREASARYDDREPEVLVIGAGQAGLSLGARLRVMGIDALLVESNERVGDNWRNRYHSLTLHNEIWVNHLPFMPFPPSWPLWTPKDLIGDWFEAYAKALELNVWTGTRFLGGSFDEAEGRWTVEVERPDGRRTLRPRHVVLAIGLNGLPHMADIPGMAEFRGEVEHSWSFSRSHEFAGKHCVVFGTGTSGHDAAQELHGAGAARVTLVQRQPTTVISIDPSSRYVYGVYEEGVTTEQADLIVQAGGSYATTKRGLQVLTREMREMDRELLDKLERAGFRVDFGEDGTGHQMKQLQKGGGFYIDVGCADLIIRGEIDLVQHADFDRLVAEGLRMKDGSVIPADLLILATGYKPLQSAVEQFFGPEVAERVGPVWGFGEDGELRNMWRPTAQRNLWFAGGSFSQCRMYSKVLAQQLALAGTQRDTDPYAVVV